MVNSLYEYKNTNEQIQDILMLFPKVSRNHTDILGTILVNTHCTKKIDSIFEKEEMKNLTVVQDSDRSYTITEK